ncbi:MAG: universal stress protein [Alphaproteobacteria bacterium]|nr:universal stress protein [Alphaproteobacteria bacterium]
MPYLHATKKVTVLSIVDDGADEDKKLGVDAIAHLKHHVVKAVLAQVKTRADIGKTLLAEVRKRKADLIVMGGYGHSRLREWLLGGVTDKMLHNAPVPLLVAH